jgi:hypothetical protein
MSEIATAIGDLKLKAAEVWPTVQVVSQLHCTYAELAPALVLQLKKVFEPAFSEAYPDRRERLSRRRSTLRLLYVPLYSFFIPCMLLFFTACSCGDSSQV